MLVKMIFASVVIMALVACASNSEQSPLDERLADMGYLINAADQRIPRYRVNGWTRVDDRNLIISSGVHDHYLVELRG